MHETLTGRTLESQHESESFPHGEFSLVHLRTRGHAYVPVAVLDYPHNSTTVLLFYYVTHIVIGPSLCRCWMKPLFWTVSVCL